MQASKMTKRSIIIFFINLNLVFMQEYLSYKNMNKMEALLIKLSYGKIIW